MSKEVDRASVFRATKVRTKLKGDASWMQRCSEPQSEAEEEKPWMAEVRVNRPNGAPIDTSPMSSPTSKTPPSPRPAEERAPSPGNLIRGVFTKTDTKPAATSSTSNSFRVPHTVRPTSNLPVQTEDQLSPEEKEKREEAAMDVLRSSSVQQRSYVLSAAKKYDSADKPPETSPTPDVPSFVAKRVVITDNDDSVFTETPSVPKETAAPSVKGVSPVSGKDVSPVCVKDVPPVCVKDVSPVSVKDFPPVCVKAVSPVRVKDVPPVSVKDVSPVSVKAVSPVCVKDVSPVSVKDVSPVSVKDVSPVSVKAVSPVSVKDVPTVCVKDVLLPAPVIVDTPAVKPGCTKMATPLPELTVEVMKKLSPESGVPLKDVPPVYPVLVSPVPYNSVKTDPAPVDTLTALSDTLISFDTGSSSLEEELVEPIPPSPGFWSQELLSGSDRYSVSTEAVSPDSPTPSTDSSVNENMLEALADDVIPIDRDTNTTRLTWKRSWDVNPITTTDKSEDEEDEEPEEQEDPQVSLVTVQKQSSESDSPWDRWSAPTVYKEKETEKRDPEPSMDRSNSYSSTLDSSANQRPKSPDTESKKGFVYLKEYVNATDLTKHNTRDDPDYVTSSSSSHFYSSPSSSTRSTMTSACTYCGEQVGNDAKITIEHLNISCHPACFKCGVCSKPMGDFLFNMFLHKGTVHCESCYGNVF